MAGDLDLHWRCGNVILNLDMPRIMGVVNVTPDSFSDDGKNPDKAIEHALQLMEDGADIIDVGGESTRPGFTPVSVDEEAKRVVPVVRELLAAGTIVSIDTRKPEVAQLCLNCGAHIINDISGFTNPDMVKVASGTACGCIITHAGEVSYEKKRKSVLLDTDPRASQQVAREAAAAEAKEGTSMSEEVEELMQEVSQEAAISNTASVTRTNARHFPLPDAAPIMRRVMGFLGDQARLLMKAGVDRGRIAMDPGAGFGKYPDEDVVIQRFTSQMVSMGYPLVTGVSRKSFLGAITATLEANHRDAATLGAVLAAAEQGARILRVHNVRALKDALTTYWTMNHPTEFRAFISLGSNMGDRITNIEKATKMIDELPLTCVEATSHIYETDPALGLVDPVANAVIEVKTELIPDVLLDHLMAIEKVLGRVRHADAKVKAPRTIDCDLVFVEGETSASEHLTLPHPGLGERDFVLIPMEDLMVAPVRYLTNAGVRVLEREDRYGIVREDLGELNWQG